jgi:hypothetical protein
LGDHHVHALLGGRPGLGHRVYLVENLGAGRLRAAHEVAGVAQRERHRGGGRLERDLERPLVQARNDVVHRERPVGQLAHPRDPGAQVVGRRVDRAEAAQPAGFGHGRDQLGRCGRPNRSLQDGSVDLEELAERGAEHGASSAGGMTAAS